MKATLNIPAQLLTSIDMINTLSGGTVEPQLRFQQFETFRQIGVRIPSIETGDIKIEIQNNVLMIYYFIPLMSRAQKHDYPRIIYNKAIPYFIDRDSIVAAIDENELIVTLPYNELAGGFKRTVPIAS